MSELNSETIPLHDHHDRSAAPIIAEGLSARYNGGRALDSMSFQIEQGERVAVVGPNGAGKTTLFKVIAGILKPSSGSIVVYGHGPGKHVCVGYVAQRTQVDLDFPVTAGDVVMMGRIRDIGLFRWPRGLDQERVSQAMARVGVSHLRQRQIGELSGGQQQRVFLAQVVAQGAQIALLDEPLSGLDTPSRELIFEILDDLKSQGVTVLVATHDLNLAAKQFDRVMLINRSLVAFGSPKDALTAESLQEAYGGHLHVLSDVDGTTVIVDTHHEGRH